MREILMANAQPGVHFEVLSNPEFLAEGTAIKNLLHPDRILIGSLDTEAGYSAAESLVDVYANWIPREKLITMNLWSSELAKLAANAMLAQRISSINAFSSICEAVSANIQDVAYAVGLDSRIGPKMMNASVGFGGSCFKKDILNLVYISESLNLPEVAAYWHSVIAINEYQKDRFVRRIVKAMHSTLYQKKIAILGFAYKKDTGDTRESAAIDVVTALLAENATIHIFDPQVRPEQIMSDLRLTMDDDRVTICDSPYDACQDAHGVVILTEWDMFSNKHAKVGPSSANPLLNVTNKQLNGLNGHITSETNGTNGTLSTSSSFNDVTKGFSSSHSKTDKIDWSRVANIMDKPMYVFDGRNTIDVGALEQLGFQVEAIGVASASSIAMAK
jgi:UDPglucose 6-dehydrogenase